ncbi:CDGSH iron-sulfur domain-containing protein [Babesia bigemina]|uniref:CDGSH iron-sulfur domain-containing protein n=1 Tax=Babesia bigemina TaxID=5866 RepID=A0A061D2X6_BABBI|nr:CDGSH iron-sulfur domain-containing protein [Babesia bigemina]CDR95126.1 CDGSH iron-sulfur domain-containing protein [Babesia bigemina]|eukprot:XP_012767312.1 CDGSH iron-sulfur domain-containing protein [Babesia bigemina]
MSNPLECYEKLDFNTRQQPLYSHVIENFPKSDRPDVVVRLCRCWQSHKFPYCDDTHKLLVENGDDVGPFVAHIRAERSKKREYVKLRQRETVPGVSRPSALHRMPSSRALALG